MLGMIATAAVATPLATVLILASRKPDSFRIERSTSIDAPPAKVLEWIDDFRRWVDWSPWEELDPDLKRTFSGPERGKGAVYEWLGNKRAGAGRMEVIEVTDGSKVEIKLDFIAPFEAHNFAEFTLHPHENGTEVTWAMYGPSPFIAKLMYVFFDMEKGLGTEFEKGLASLKSVAER